MYILQPCTRNWLHSEVLFSIDMNEFGFNVAGLYLISVSTKC